MTTTIGWHPMPNSLSRAGIKIKPAETRIIAVLASHGLDHTWPSHKTLASESGMGVTAVKDNLNRLREKGILTWKPRKRDNGSHTSNEYRFLIDMWGGAAPQLLTGQNPTEGGVGIRLGGRPESDYPEEQPLNNNQSKETLSIKSKDVPVEKEDLSSVISQASEKAMTSTPQPLTRNFAPSKVGYTADHFKKSFPDVKAENVLASFFGWHIGKGDTSLNWFEKFLSYATKAQEIERERRKTQGVETDSMGNPLDVKSRLAQRRAANDAHAEQEAYMKALELAESQLGATPIENN